MAILFVALFCGFAALLLLLQTLLADRAVSASAVRLRRLTVRREPRRTNPRAHLQRLVVLGAGKVRGRAGLLKEEQLAEKLATAGLSGELAPDLYLAARVAGLPLGLLLGALVPGAPLLGAVLGGACLWISPSLLLRYLTGRRKASIRRSMPDLVDLLVICVDAGLGLDQAVLRVAEELAVSHPATREELLQVGGEQRAGKPRMQAWSDMAKRLALPEVDALVSMLVQADRFGTPIARALGTFAQTMRLRRTQKAEEQAAKTTVKILFPLVLFLFPTIFIVLLGPAVLTMVRSFAGGLR